MVILQFFIQIFLLDSHHGTTEAKNMHCTVQHEAGGQK